LRAEILYVVGGLYGNLGALDAIEALAAAEAEPVTIVFNGDFHWFDAEPDWFAAIDARVARHHAIRGNVETEIARPDDIGAGCGCAYPASVATDTVERSNAILRELRAVVGRDCAVRLTTLPMHLVAEVGGLRIGIVHGDATSLAGWNFSHDRLADPAAQADLRALQAASSIDVFASTHTCAAALCDVSGHSRLTVINNGAAGMANFFGTSSGLISRIAILPSPHRRLYGLVRDGVYVDAVPVHFDMPAFLGRFLTRWPEHSPAHASYFGRIVNGPDHRIEAPAVTA
jgi:predicted phosphodiesterase